MQKYKRLARTTLRDLAELATLGVYVIAYMGRVFVCWKASLSVG